MTFSALHGAAAGAIVTGGFVAFALRPAGLVPHPSSTPSLDAPRSSATSPGSPVARATRSVVVVYVAGAVAHPGVYSVDANARAIDAVAKAGGLTRDADALAVNLAAHVADGDEIAVPRAGESLPPPENAASSRHTRAKKRSGRGRHRRAANAGVAAARPIVPAPRAMDLNTADEAALATVPGIGETLASRIVEFREINGRFASVDGLADVSGITPSRYDAIAPFLTVGGP